MADVQPLSTLRYDLNGAGSLGSVIAPPYDVIDPGMRARLAARSPFNVVELDLPQAPGADPYAHAAETFAAWRHQGVLVREREPAVWVLAQAFTGPDGRARERRGFLARVRVDEYGPGRIRPHERTHPGPKQDRLLLTRATRANLSPVFGLFPDPEGAATEVVEAISSGEPYATARDDDGVRLALWRCADADAISALQGPLADAELLIADGHHRYETARAYADEVGGEGPHRYVLMLLCALSDPGLTVFATHRLLTGLRDDPAKQEALRDVAQRLFEVEQVERGRLAPDPAEPRVQFGYIDAHFRRPYRLTLKDPAVAEAALATMPAAYRRLDTAVLDALVLREALGMSDDDIDHKRGLDYSSDLAEACAAVESGAFDAAFLLRPTPIAQVREVAGTGEPMPPKSTYFFPKVPTGLVFNLLE
jgi:uncharacterized protein (DUF1015 family)